MALIGGENRWTANERAIRAFDVNFEKFRTLKLPEKSMSRIGDEGVWCG